MVNIRSLPPPLPQKRQNRKEEQDLPLCQRRHPPPHRFPSCGGSRRIWPVDKANWDNVYHEVVVVVILEEYKWRHKRYETIWGQWTISSRSLGSESRMTMSSLSTASSTSRSFSCQSSSGSLEMNTQLLRPLAIKLWQCWYVEPNSLHTCHTQLLCTLDIQGRPHGSSPG